MPQFVAYRAANSGKAELKEAYLSPDSEKESGGDRCAKRVAD
jgi:hypothetical protein